MSNFTKYLLALSLGALLVGCDKGPAEEAGEDIDEAVQDVRRSVDDATD
jgi:hypothetical protein